jgi:Copper transport outer membrane protein, MctB
MFDFRYHVASLAAVFVALVIGILVGVGLSGRSVVTESERIRFEDRIDRLERQLEVASLRSDEQQAAQAFEGQAYSAVMENRLRDRNVGLVFVGSVDQDVRDTVVRAVEDDAGGTVARMRALKLPVDGTRLEAAISGMPEAAELVGAEGLPELGSTLAQELVRGEETPLWNAVAPLIEEERSGGMQLPVDAVVVVRNAQPQQGETARFLNGFYRGLASAGVPAVGVESTDTDPTAIPVYRSAGFSTVNNVDTPSGRVSLAVLLNGDQRGHFGFDAEDGFLPSLEPVPPPAG